MALINANGLNVLGASIQMPRVGVWTMELDLDGTDAAKATGAVTLTVGSVAWKGTAVEVGAYVGRVHARVLGGAGGFGKATKPKFYAAIPARVVATDLLAEGGETLSATSDASLLGTVLPFWTRPAGTVGEGLETLLEDIGATYRVLPDGTVWVGAETWPKATAADVVVEADVPQDSRIVFSSTEPTVLPGTTFKDKKVARVAHKIAPGETRTTVWYENGEPQGDPLRVALDGLVRQATKHVDFYAVRAGKATSQNADGTLEIKLDDADMPGLSKVPIAYGIPGVIAKIKKGARVHVEFADGSPKNPRAVVIDSTGLVELTVKATKVLIDADDVEVKTPAGAKPVARQGDPVQVVSTPPGTIAAGFIVQGNPNHRG
jgi:hypothetical protein